MIEQAKQIVKNATIIDGQLAFEHAMPWDFEEKWRLVDRYAQAGFTAVTLSLGNEETTMEQGLTYLARIKAHIKQNTHKYILAHSKEDILQAKDDNKIALRLMFQGTSIIGKNLDLLPVFYELGVTSLVLAYNIRTPIGDGVIEQEDAGLSHLGKKFVAQMNQLGMIIDGSHAGYRTSMEALALSKAPMVFSHSAAYSLHSHVRNVRDDQIQAVAATGGVIGITGLGLLLGDTSAKISSYVDHVDYVAKLVGSDHVAIGLDYLYFADRFAEFMADQPTSHPGAYAQHVGDATKWRCLQPEDIAQVVAGLLARGYVQEEIEGFLGNNILRII